MTINKSTLSTEDTYSYANLKLYNKSKLDVVKIVTFLTKMNIVNKDELV